MHLTVSRMAEGGGASRPCMASSLSGLGGVMPTVISKMGPERVRRRTVPRTSPTSEAMSPTL
jgi:hypothetical protein